MTPSSNCIALIQEFKGCAMRLADGTFAAYPDPKTGGGPWTIGWDATGPDVAQGTIWTQRQCDDRLVAEVTNVAARVEQALGGAPTTQSQFDALVGFAHEVGLGNLSSSILVRKHRAGDYAGAALEFDKWNKTAGKVMPGLTRRRAFEASLYRS